MYEQVHTHTCMHTHMYINKNVILKEKKGACHFPREIARLVRLEHKAKHGRMRRTKISMGLIPGEFLGFAKFRFYFKRDMSSESFRWGTAIISVTSRMYIYPYQDKTRRLKGP